MAEILGVAASATQLYSACFSLIDIVKKIKGGASTLKRYHGQLQELQSLSTSISQNPLLQTPEIGSQTDALLNIINNNCLNPLLRKGRFLRTWGFLYREQDLLDIFVRLEQQKSNLSLAIEQIQSQALYQIQTDIQVMSEEKKRSTSSFVSATKSGPLVHNRSFGSVSSTPSIPADIQALTLYAQSLAYPNMYPNGSPNGSPTGSSSSFSDNSTGNRDEQPASGPGQPNIHTSTYNSGAQYNNSFAGPGFNQINGPVYRGDGALSKELANNSRDQNNTNRHVYNNSTKTGHGDQHNGRFMEIEGDIRGATEPNMNGYEWNNCKVMPWISTDSGVVIYGTQTNGPITQQKRKEGKREE